MKQNVTHPAAALTMANGAKIVFELLPEAAPNTVNSFIYAAQNGFYDGHAIERIVPGSWIDLSYKAFGREEAKYLIPWEYELHPEITPLPVHPGCVCMGGYGVLGEAGCEVYFPLRDCPEQRGVYPVFGRIRSGMEELYRLEQVPTRPITNYPIPGVEVNEPLSPEVIESVTLTLNGYVPGEVVRIPQPKLPKCWKMTWD